MVGIHNLALAEGFAIAAKSGIPADSFLELVQLGSAGSKAADLKGRKIIEHDFSNQFSLALMLKDLKLASSLTDSLSIPAPMLSIAKSLFQAGQTQGYGDEDLSAVVKTYEAWIETHHWWSTSRISCTFLCNYTAVLVYIWHSFRVSTLSLKAECAYPF